MKFQIGDHIEANVLSNDAYSHTNERRKWKGYVVAIAGAEDECIGVAEEENYVVGSAKLPNVDWWVDEKYFDLIPEENCDMPDGNLFDVLFGR